MSGVQIQEVFLCSAHKGCCLSGRLLAFAHHRYTGANANTTNM